jgi:hypothetical protein
MSPSKRTLHLTIDGASVLSGTHYDTLFTYAEKMGWMSRDRHGEHSGTGIRITDKPASILIPLKPASSDPAKHDTSAQLWRDVVRSLGVWSMPAKGEEAKDPAKGLWVCSSTET